MRTLTVVVDPARPDPASLREAARRLREGGLVVFPTETVYGLGADATSGKAVSAVFRAKGRPADNPLIVHVASTDEVAGVARDIPAVAEILMRRFWPGPLSLVLKRSAAIAPEVSCGLDTVAVRMPAHPVALELIRLAGVPVAAPSANRSGRPSPTRAADALADLDGLVDYVIDAGPCPVGLESTVLDLSGPTPVVLRPGGVTVEQLRAVVGEVRLLGEVDPDASARAARSPGTRHLHYSPKADLILVRPGPAGPGTALVAKTIADLAEREAAAGRKVGVASTRETARRLEATGQPAARSSAEGPEATRPATLPAAGGPDATRAATRPGGPAAGSEAKRPASPPIVVIWGNAANSVDVAASLFSTLRDLDRAGVDVIIAEGTRPEGLGLAVDDRLTRAASRVVDLSRRESIVVVCTGNTCRSPMAAALLEKHLEAGLAAGGDAGTPRRAGAPDAAPSFEVVSAGTAASDGEPASADAVSAMREMGLDISGHRSRRVTAEMISAARLILTLEERHRAILLAAYPAAADRVFTLKGYAGSTKNVDVVDPIGRGLEVYRRTAAELDQATAEVARRLLARPGLEAVIGPAEAPPPPPSGPGGLEGPKTDLDPKEDPE